MKKFALLSLLALGFGFGFTACDDYEEPNPPAQSNPQESILQTDEVVVTNSLSGTYDLAELNNNNTPIEVARITCSTLPDTYEFLAGVQISANNFSTAVPVASTVVKSDNEDNVYVVTVSADDLQGAYVSGISKSPAAKEIMFRFNVMTKTGEQQIAYVGGVNNFYGPFTATVLPMPSELVIEDAYYLLGTINGWDVATAIKLNHAEGVSGYDDPVFSIAVDITADQAAEGWWWKVVPQSTYETGNWVDAAYGSFGVADNGDDSLEGMLVARTDTEDCGAGCLYESGQYLFSINLLEGTYAFTEYVPVLYTPGDANGWSQVGSQQLATTNGADYYGYAVLSSAGFKFTNAPDWDHINYGASDTEGTLSNDGGAGNLTVPETGLYWCHVNTASLTYEVTLISTIGVIGDATPGGWDASTALTPSADFLTWTGTINFGAGEFKFRANDGWDVNLGGSYTDLVQDGANLATPGQGTYTVTLDLSTLPYACSFK